MLITCICRDGLLWSISLFSESVIRTIVRMFSVGCQLVLLMSSGAAVVNASTTCTDVTVVSIALMDPTKYAVCIHVSRRRDTVLYSIMLLCIAYVECMECVVMLTYDTKHLKLFILRNGGFSFAYLRFHLSTVCLFPMLPTESSYCSFFRLLSLYIC